MPISKFVSCLFSPHKLNHFLRRILVFDLSIVDISTGESTEKSREGGGTEAAMQVGDKSSVRERVESEEGRLWGLGDRRDGEKPQV